MLGGMLTALRISERETRTDPKAAATPVKPTQNSSGPPRFPGPQRQVTCSR